MAQLRTWSRNVVWMGLLVAVVLAAHARRASAEDADAVLRVSLVFTPRGTPRSYFAHHLRPGQGATDVLEVANPSDHPMFVWVYGADAYNASDGALTGSRYGQSNHDAGGWISVDAPRLYLEAGQSARVTFRFRVPPGTPAGDHLAFLFLEPVLAPPAVSPSPRASATETPVQYPTIRVPSARDEKEADRAVVAGGQAALQPDSERDHEAFHGPDTVAAPRSHAAAGEPTVPQGSGLNVTRRVGICVWERVPGTLRPSLRISRVDPSIGEEAIYVQASLTNTGNTFVRAAGSWTLSSPDGARVAFQPREDWGYVLPGHPLQRQVLVSDAHTLPPGRYWMRLNIDYGQNGRLTDRFAIDLP